MEHVPEELRIEIITLLHPLDLIRCQRVSGPWREIFKSNIVWKSICLSYGMSYSYFSEETNYFILFLERYAAIFITEKMTDYYGNYYLRLEGQPLRPVPAEFSKLTPNRDNQLILNSITFPGNPKMIVGLSNTHLLAMRSGIYEQHFKQKRIHRNLATQNLLLAPSLGDTAIAFFEYTDDYLMNILMARPDLVTEANICQIAEQLLSAFAWLTDRQIRSPYIFTENIRANLLPNDKIEIKIHSALLDFSGNRPAFGLITMPPEGPQQWTDKSYAWTAGWLVYFFLTGRYAFYNKSPRDQVEAVMKVNYSFHEQEDSHVTPMARNFISKLLAKEPDRMTVQEALKHEWILQSNKNHEPYKGLTQKYQIQRDLYKADQ